MINLVIFLINLICVSAASIAALTLGAEGLTALMSLLVVCANLFVNKSILLLGFEITPTDSLAVGAGLTLNILREYYGAPAAKRAIGVSFFILMVFIALSQLVLAFEPSSHDIMSSHYDALLRVMPRLGAASAIAYLLSQLTEFYLYSMLKAWTHGKHFLLRNYISLSVSQLVDTLLFSFLGLYGIVYSMVDIITFCYVAKFITIIMSASLIAVLRRFVKPAS